MKFYYSIFVFTFLIASCQNEKSSSEIKEKSQVVETDTNLVPENISTAEPMICSSLGGPPFELDTIRRIDSLEVKWENESSIAYLNFTAYFPQSNLERHYLLNTAVRNLIMNFYQEHILTKSQMDVTADIWVSDYSWNGDLVSFVFTEQDYYEGAAHYNHEYRTLNFDLKNNKIVKLTDLLIFKTGEAQKFCDAFNPDYATDSKYRQVDLEGKDFTDDRPFMVNGDEIVIYFHDYEKGPSMTKVYIPYSKIKGYVNPAYQNLFQ